MQLCTAPGSGLLARVRNVLNQDRVLRRLRPKQTQDEYVKAISKLLHARACVDVFCDRHGLRSTSHQDAHDAAVRCLRVDDLQRPDVGLSR